MTEPTVEPVHSSGINPHETLSVHDLRQRFPGGLSFECSLQTEDFPRLMEEKIRVPEGIVLRVEFSSEALTLSAEVEVELACRRCAEPMRRPLAFHRRFQLFDTASQADEALDVDSEEVDTLATQDEASLASLVEDEILLDGLTAPAHADCQISVTGSAGAAGSDRPGGTDRIRPFSGLAQLLGRNSDE